MNLATALNEKNRIARRVRELQKKITANNSYIKGSTPAYDSIQLLAELNDTVAKLTVLKTQIMRANQPIQHKIFRLAELKSFAAFLRALEIKEGKVLAEGWKSEVTEWEASLGTVERDKILEKTEQEIDSLQIELNKFNFETELDNELPLA